MRISEVEKAEKTLDQIHQEWLMALSNSANPPSKQQKDYVYSRAKTNMQAGLSAATAHVSAQNQWSEPKANQQRKKGKFVGTTMGSRERDAEKRSRGAQKGNQNAVKPNGQVRTGADGRQLRHDRWHGTGDRRDAQLKGKNAIQQMKDKWEEFQKADGTLGKDVAKGSFIAKGAEKIGKGIVAMGDRARAAAKGRFN